MKFYVSVSHTHTHTHTHLALELLGNSPAIVHQGFLTLHRGVDEQQAVHVDAGAEDHVCSLKTHTHTHTHTHNVILISLSTLF